MSTKLKMVASTGIKKITKKTANNCNTVRRVY